MGMILEDTGIIAERVADREKWGRFAYKAPAFVTKTHQITVNCKTGERMVETKDHCHGLVPIAKPAPAPAVDETIALRAKIATLHNQLAAKEQQLRELIGDCGVAHVSIGEVQTTFCDILFVEGYRLAGRRYEVADMKAVSRSRAYAWPRGVCMAVVRRVCCASSTVIGMAFGGRDHTSVLEALKRVDRRLEEMPVLATVHAKALTLYGIAP